MHRVLVIADDASVLTDIRVLLELLGVRAEEAENGEEGLRRASEYPPDLILCAPDTPVTDRCETLERCAMTRSLAGYK